MLDIGWSEMAVIAILALIVIGPKDLPRVMRTMGHWVRKARSVSREFQSSVDEMMREAELDDAKKAIQSAKSMSIDRAIEDTIDPTGTVKEEVKAVETAARADASDETDTKVDGAAQDSSAVAKQEPAEQATVIKHPAQPAPPHSVVPPPDPHAKPKETAEAAPTEAAVESDTPSASGQKSA